MIYFIRDGNYIKIGISVDPWKRLASFQTSHHNELELLAVMPGSEDLEAGLHRSFARFSKRGEWFEQNPQLLAFIETVRTTFPDAQWSIPELPKEEARAPLEHGGSFIFCLTHKKDFRSTASTPAEMWSKIEFINSGYWRERSTDEWWVLYAPGLRFDFESMQHVRISRVGEVLAPTQSPYGLSIRSALKIGMNIALGNTVYNHDHNSPWLSVYNTQEYGLILAIKRNQNVEGRESGVPKEVIDHWRQYQYKSPLPDGVSIEA